MTNQEMFDTVLNGIRAQGAFSRDDSGCYYRHPNGAKCAAGLLIPDDRYDPSFEGYGVHGVPLFVELFPDPEARRLLGQLQSAHDSAEDMIDWENHMIMIAEDHQLTYEAPK